MQLTIEELQIGKRHDSSPPTVTPEQTISSSSQTDNKVPQQGQSSFSQHLALSSDLLLCISRSFAPTAPTFHPCRRRLPRQGSTAAQDLPIDYQQPHPLPERVPRSESKFFWHTVCLFIIRLINSYLFSLLLISLLLSLFSFFVFLHFFPLVLP